MLFGDLLLERCPEGLGMATCVQGRGSLAARTEGLFLHKLCCFCPNQSSIFSNVVMSAFLKREKAIQREEVTQPSLHWWELQGQ